MNNIFYYKYILNRDFNSLADYALGINSNLKDLKNIDHYIHKATFNSYSHFKIPIPLKDLSEISSFEKKLETKKIKLVVLLDLKKALLTAAELKPGNTSFEFIIDKHVDQEEFAILAPAIDSLISNNTDFKITIIIHRSLKLFDLLETFSAYNKYLSIYFSPNFNNNHHFLNCKEIHELKNLPKFNIEKSPWQVLWDHRVKENLELVPHYDPVIISNTHSNKIHCSLIIPTFNNKKYIVQTLNNIFNLNYPAENFEVLIIDDGSEDGTHETLISYFKDYLKLFNFKYFYLPRTSRRTMGDAQYRAGIARNFAKNRATGEFFFFLDSDIIINSEYLNQNLELLKDNQVVQSIRLDLTSPASIKNHLYNDVNLTSDIENLDPYWTDFHNNIEDWNQVDDKWKYLCTHSLVLHKNTFDKFGGFEKNFIFYGFEDTDLGYKLKDLKFYLNKSPVFHLFHNKTKSEYFNSYFIRKLLLARTAQIFYLIHLDNLIYQKFKSSMANEFSIFQIFKKITLRLKNRTIRKWQVFQLQKTSAVNK